MTARRALPVWVSFLAITAVHLLAGRATHAEHVLHLVFGALYVLPAIAAAVWLGPRSGVAAALVSAGAYALHVALGWEGDVMVKGAGITTAGLVLGVGGVTAALVAARDRERAQHAEAERRVQREAIAQAMSSLSRALRTRDDETAAHCERVAALADAVARRLGLASERVEVVRLAGLVHDLGKIGVGDDVLLKRGPLTPEERARIERHPVLAWEILAPVRGAEELAAVVLAHHEASDGTGYPRGLAGSAVSLEARIVRVADVYDALTAERPYKEALPPATALAAMRERAAGFDAAALGALEAIVARAP